MNGNPMKTIRRLPVVLLVTSVLCALASESPALPRLSVNRVRGFPGNTVEVPVSLRYASNDVRNVVALQADIAYEPALASAGTETGGTALRGHTLRSSQPAAGTRRLLAYALNNAVMTNGTVAMVSFTIPAGVRSNVRLLLENVILSDASGNAVATGTAEGAIVIEPLYVRPADRNVEGYFAGLEDLTSYVVQASTNLIEWVNVATNAPVDSFLEFMDLDAHLYPHRFYRPVPLGGAFGGGVRLDGSKVIIRLLGVAGRSYVLQASTDLANWTDLSTNVAEQGALSITNEIDPAFPFRFFRTKSE
jgi:hypothetical protein